MLKENVVAFLGRCHWGKDWADAIRVAMAAGVPLVMVYRVTAQEQPSFDQVVDHAKVVVFPSPWEPLGTIAIPTVSAD